MILSTERFVLPLNTLCKHEVTPVETKLLKSDSDLTLTFNFKAIKLFKNASGFPVMLFVMLFGIPIILSLGIYFKQNMKINTPRNNTSEIEYLEATDPRKTNRKNVKHLAYLSITMFVLTIVYYTWFNN